MRVRIGKARSERYGRKRKTRKKSKEDRRRRQGTTPCGHRILGRGGTTMFWGGAARRRSAAGVGLVGSGVDPVLPGIAGSVWRRTALIYGEKFEEALTYAARLHRTQMRKGTNVPYVTHLLAVAAIVGENGGTEDEVIAALLHDAVEDQGGAATREEIRKRFGDTVATIVDGTSDTDVIPKPPWQERKRNYVAHVSGASKSVRLVSAADKLHNARSILRDQIGRASCRVRV